MAYPFNVRWLTLKQLIELFVTMGCVLNTLDQHLEGPNGAYPVRYLYSPMTNDFVSLLDYEDNEKIPPSEVENWERRLGIEIPKGDGHS